MARMYYDWRLVRVWPFYLIIGAVTYDQRGEPTTSQWVDRWFLRRKPARRHWFLRHIKTRRGVL